MMQCPKCRLLNPETALRCDCGYDFTTGSVQSSYIQKKRTNAALPRAWVGFLLAVVFLIAEIAGTISSDLTPLMTAVGLFAWAYWLHCVYRFHEIMEGIAGYDHPISSSKAVAMHFIPLYNLYWTFKWPKAMSAFVNWRTQSQSMNGSLVGLLVLFALLVSRLVDGFIGFLFLFGAGVYISHRISLALAAPPVPQSAMAPPGVRGPLGL